MFQFNGHLDISKSWMNRALIIQSWTHGAMTIQGESISEDVILLKKALVDFQNGKKEFYAGLGGTTFRFLALRLSREKGTFFIRAEKSLLQRPQKELLNIFSQLGVQAELTSEGLQINSAGWREPARTLKVSTRESSQFLSAVLLSAINLNFDLHIMVEDEFVSEDYFKYTLQLLDECGVAAVHFEDSLFIKKNQKVKVASLIGEVDVSSAFSLAVAGVLNGQVEIKNWKNTSAQPDIHFLNFFERMGIEFIQSPNNLKIKKAADFRCIHADLSQCPDLFPVLAVLCAFARGESHLYGATQLKFKESDRIAKTTELLSQCGFQVQALNDGMKIQGGQGLKNPFDFDPTHDHRMAMAAAILKLQGFPIHLLDADVIKKSYPQFYQHIGLNL